MANPFAFFQEVRSEVRKIVWPSRRETIISSIIVLVLAAIASAFFFLFDQLFAWIISQILMLR